MSLVREAARLPLGSCLKAVNTSCQRTVKYQDSFEGVFNPFLWDEGTGFGISKEDKTVLVSSKYKRDLSSKSESDIWQDIIDPTTLMCHEALRDELQMRVLAYDDDVLKLGPSAGDITMIVPQNGKSSGGQNTGCNGGSRTLKPTI